MTRDDIMNASPEQLNEWTAIHVMGWSDINERGWRNAKGKIVGAKILWRPAVDHNDKYKLMDEMCEPKELRELFMNELRVLAHGEHWKYVDGSELIWTLQCDRVCRAALLAKGDR